MEETGEVGGITSGSGNGNGGGKAETKIRPFGETSFQTLRQIASKADLYLITRCDDTSTYERVHNILQQNGVFNAGLNPNVCFF